MIIKSNTTILVVLLFILSLSRTTDAHGYLLSPRSRNFVAYEDGVWYATDKRSEVYGKETCPHCANQGGKCGVIGANDYNYPLSFARTLMPADPQETYRRGDIITVEVVLTAHHKGHFEFNACPIQHQGDIPTKECFDQYPLEFVSDEYYNAPKDNNHVGRAYIPPISYRGIRKGGKGVSGYGFKYKMKLPSNLYGDLVLLQWHYITSNSCRVEDYEKYKFPKEWGINVYALGSCQLPISDDGGGAPEQFWNCAEISIPDRTISAEASINVVALTPNKSPTDSIFTTTPTRNPIATPTKNPTVTPTRNPTAVPTKSPAIHPTTPVVSTIVPAPKPIDNIDNDNDFESFLLNESDEFYMIEVLFYNDTPDHREEDSYDYYLKDYFPSNGIAEVVVQGTILDNKHFYVVKYTSGMHYHAHILQNQTIQDAYQMYHTTNLKQYDAWATKLITAVPSDLTEEPMSKEELPFYTEGVKQETLFFHALSFLDTADYSKVAFPETTAEARPLARTGKDAVDVFDKLASPVKGHYGIRAIGWFDVKVTVASGSIQNHQRELLINYNDDTYTSMDEIRIEVIPSLVGLGESIQTYIWTIAAAYREAGLTEDSTTYFANSNKYISQYDGDTNEDYI
eukprot:CAMPEP_0194195924 /NCGR_PEP_ID=MMETSP0154-20130528/76393_1 /TAXON_ID=1049557 /ORGANISM="Thalassiothrix antarctica, Strain L6-D1" /LENGTH=625 /DNA_ID=CAMNT_0038920485 /DNA_START=50 /DNA_END=1927 /DNA_ORIENTATION=-